MGIEWTMIDEPYHDEEAITEALRSGFEPFAVTKTKVFFRKQFFNEDSESKSSTRPENANWAGKETTE